MRFSLFLAVFLTLLFPLFAEEIRQVQNELPSESTESAEDSPAEERLFSACQTAEVKLSNGQTYFGRLIIHFRQSDGTGLTALQKQNGSLELIHSEEITELTADPEPFTPLTAEELGEELIKDLGGDYHLHTTKHFLFVHRTSATYAIWCGKLFESLYTAFDAYQDRLGLKLPDPEFPMAVLLLPNREEFDKYAQKEGTDAAGLGAYFNRNRNRVILYDFSGQETFRGDQQRKKRTSQDISSFLSRPEASNIVTTVIHEATHQIAFNRDLFLRTGPYPLWAVEGLSMYFEVPDPRSPQGWSFRGTRGKPNQPRLADLVRTLNADSETPIREIVREEKFNDDLLRSYSLSWGVFYYLQSKEPEKLADYLELTRKKDPFAVYSPDERIADFERCFGNDWEKLNKNFYKFLRNIR